jgi:MerR family transcriptional regulator, redox-sensitive transcriptional activator SoxR
MLPIGALARRTGLAVSAIRYYEAQGLIRAQRTRGNQRRFLRSDIRRLSFILIAQRLGLALADIEDALASLPPGKTPTAPCASRSTCASSFSTVRATSLTSASVAVA